MPNDQYDSLLKPQLQRLAESRGLDSEGTVAVLKDRLRASDQVSDPDPDEGDFPPEEEEEETADDEEPESEAAEVADEGDDNNNLKDGYFRHTITAGNNLFFDDPFWNIANEELALAEAAKAGYRYHPNMGKIEWVPDGNRMHYQFPVEREVE